MAFFRELGARHAALKHKIHTTKIILPPWGVKVMKVVYFSVPVAGGYVVMQWATSRADRNLASDPHFQALKAKVEQRKAAAAPAPGASGAHSTAVGAESVLEEVQRDQR